MNFKRLKHIFILVAVTVSVLGMASCGGSDKESGLTVQDEVVVYAEVIRQLATVDDTYGGNLNPATIYVIKNTDDKVGNPGDQEARSKAIPDTSHSNITGMLSDLSAEIIWVDKFEDAEFEQTQYFEVKNGGAIITLGNIYVQADGSVQVAGSIYTASMAAGGTTYVLEKVDGSWEITGRVGGFWIS